MKQAIRRALVATGLVDSGPEAQLAEEQKRLANARARAVERAAERDRAWQQFCDDENAYEAWQRADAFAKREEQAVNKALEAVAEAEAAVKEQALAAKRKRCDELRAELTVELVSEAAAAFHKREADLVAALAELRVEQRLELVAPISAKQDELRRGLLDLGEPVGRVEEIIDGRTHVRDAIPDRTGLVGSLRAVAELLQKRIDALPAGDPLRDALGELARKNYPMQLVNAGPPPQATVHEQRADDSPLPIKKAAWFQGSSNGKRAAQAQGE